MFSLLRRSATIGQKHLFQARCFSTAAPDFSKYDPSQTKFLDESLILVDREDNIVGKVSKVDGHLNSFNKTGPAHRAFSVFLFNEQNQLLLHQRSEKKITFPALWTNSCCSHPLYNDEEIVADNYIGAKKAIRRRVEYELGYDLKDIQELDFLGKIYYQAECDETWGEHELDYCFFIKRDFKEQDFKFNKDEIKAVKWVGRNEIMSFLSQRYQHNERVTPWFGAIMHYKLFEWWDVLIRGDIKNFTPAKEIADLNSYQKPLFNEVNGVLRSNVPASEKVLPYDDKFLNKKPGKACKAWQC